MVTMAIVQIYYISFHYTGLASGLSPLFFSLILLIRFGNNNTDVN